MGLLDWIFGKRKSEPEIVLSPSVKSRFETAIQRQGGKVCAWNATRADVELGDELQTFDLVNLYITARRLNREISDDDFADFLRKIEEGKKRRDETKIFANIEHLLRPRVLSGALANTQRHLACREYVEDHLVRALTVDWGEVATYVTDSLLKEWDKSFDEVFNVGIEQLKLVSSREQFHPVEGVYDILASNCQDGISSSRCLILNTLFSEVDPVQGILFSVPTNDVLLVHLVKGKASAAAPTKMINVSAELFRSRPRPLTCEVFWIRGNDVSRLNMILTVSNATGALSINVICAGVMEEYLKLTGGI